MNLRVFHVVFITASALLAFLFAAWCLRALPPEGPARLIAAGSSAFLGAVLVAYEVRFLRKTKGIS